MAVPGIPPKPAGRGHQPAHPRRRRARAGRPDVAEELGLERPEGGLGKPQPPATRYWSPRPHIPSEPRRAATARSGLETSELLARLTELELSDEVRRLPGALFVRHH